MQDSTSFFMSMDVYRLCANSRYDILILDYTLGENNPERRILKVIIKRLKLWENTTKLLGVKGMTANVIQVVASAATTAASTVTEATTEGKLDNRNIRCSTECRHSGNDHTGGSRKSGKIFYRASDPNV